MCLPETQRPLARAVQIAWAPARCIAAPSVGGAVLVFDADRGLCDHFAAIFLEAPPVNAVAGRRHRRRSADGGWRCGTGLLLAMVVAAMTFPPGAPPPPATPCSSSALLQRHGAGCDLRRAEAPTAAAWCVARQLGYSLCRFSAAMAFAVENERVVVAVELNNPWHSP